MAKAQKAKGPKNLPQDGGKPREAILSAALKAFARDGYDGASMPKIAKMAQVAPTLIHYYFGSKENLWRETVDYSLGELRRESVALQKATRSLAPLDRLRALLEAHSHFAAQWPDHFAMIVAEARADSDRFAWIQENYTGILFGEVVGILEEARECGAIEPVNTEQAAFMLIGSILLYFTVRPKPFEGQNLEKFSGEFTDLIFRTFLHGLAIRPAG
ncbi:MAG: TetR/AcrR family transcriptional regulator [Oxalobacteraceae bacterium]|nr:MAG: TetR/AcrR family transcriptional regulator [Oxalobacteraceae bacterium]